MSDQDKEDPVSPSSSSLCSQERVQEAISALLPSEDAKAYHPTYYLPLSLSILLGLLALFLGLFIPTIYNEMQNRYLSPAADSDPSLCETVTISNTGTFYATKEGDWSGSSGYTYTATSYAMRLNNKQYTPSAYTNDMQSIHDRLRAEGEASRNYSLGTILTYWMSYVLISSDSRSQRFTLHGNPLSVFKREKVSSAIGTRAGVCMLPSTITSYSSSTGRLTMIMENDELRNDSICSWAATPQNFGYNGFVDAGKVQISIDVRALITSYAVNEGILGLHQLEEIVASRKTFPYLAPDGLVYDINISSFYDPRYPDMTYLTCLTDNFLPTACIIEMGEIIALPVFHHSGRSMAEPIPCDCQDPDIGDLSDPHHPCYIFTLMSGILYYNVDGPDPLFELAMRYSLPTVAKKAFLPMFLSSAFGLSSPNRASLYSDASLSEAFDWCYHGSSGYCHVVTFTSWDYYRVDFSVNEYYHQLQHGACRDTFSTSSDQWQRLVSTPFAQLSQEYTVCKQSLYNSVINSVGVASANVSLFSPLVIILFLWLALVVQKCSGHAWPRGYHQRDKDELIDDLAVTLLLLRDGKLSSSPSSFTEKALKKLQLTRIVKELKGLSRQRVRQYQQVAPRQGRVFTRSFCCKQLRGRKKGGNEVVLDDLNMVQAVEVIESEEKQDSEEIHYGHHKLMPLQAFSMDSAVSMV
eukprot:gene2655-2899_t